MTSGTEIHQASFSFKFKVIVENSIIFQIAPKSLLSLRFGYDLETIPLGLGFSHLPVRLPLPHSLLHLQSPPV